MDGIRTNQKSSRRAFVRSVAGASLASFADQNAFTKASIPLAVRGKEAYSIFLSAEASPSERWAAEELRRHIERMTGMQLRIDAGAGVPASRRAIAIGRSALTEKYGIEPPDGESSLLKTEGETVIVAGGRQRGTMYGVSIFLEKLGCRWFTPDIARIPEAQALWLPEFHEIHHPAFEYREVFFTEAQGREWSARNRLNGHFQQLDEGVGGKVVYMPFAHSFYDLVPPSRYFESHPEYFALVDGRRRKDGAQLCLTNAEVLRLAREQAERWLALNPQISIVSISQNDGGGWCECDPCRKVVEEEGGAISGLALRFVNQVAERLAVSYPGKTVDMLAYQDTADPPLRARPISNVQIRLCPIDACQSHSYAACPYNRLFRKRLEQWARIAPKLHIWQYSINFSHYLAPFPNYDELIADLPMFRRAGVSGVFIEGAVSEGGGGDEAELRSYLAARLLWNPLLDAPAEIRNFLAAVYGRAASMMWSCFLLRQNEVRHGQHLWVDQNVDARYLTRGFLKHGRALLQSASRKVETEAARRRIERQLLSFDYIETLRERRCSMQGASYTPADPERVNNDTQKLLRTAEELGVTQFREGYTITQQAQDWGDSKPRYAAVVLTDGSTEAVVVPDLDGRIISFGRPNLLRTPDPGEWKYPNAGGLHVSLRDGEANATQNVKWEVISSSSEDATLSGTSDSGLALNMRIEIAAEGLSARFTVANPTNSPARLRILCRAEFACGPTREALLTYRDQSHKIQNRKMSVEDLEIHGGANFAGDELPQQQWTLTCDASPFQISNRFEAGEVAQCGLGWSFRGSAGLNVAMSLASPEIELAPEAQMELTSEYHWKDLQPTKGPASKHPGQSTLKVVGPPTEV